MPGRRRAARPLGACTHCGRIQAWCNGEPRPSLFGRADIAFGEHRSGANKQVPPILHHSGDDIRRSLGAERDFRHAQAAFQQGIGQGNRPIDRLDGNHWHDAPAGQIRENGVGSHSDERLDGKIMPGRRLGCGRRSIQV